MNDLKKSILQAIKDSNDIKTVPELASKLGISVNSEFLALLYEMKRERIIIWSMREHFYLTSKGYKELEEYNDKNSKSTFL
jgi:hypothetical protein